MNTILKKIIDRWEKAKATGVDCWDVETYKALPESERTTKVWFWFGPWYRLPVGLPWDLFSEKPSEWQQCYAFLRKQYPLQTFLRNGITDSDLYSWFKFRMRRIREIYRKYVYRTIHPLNTNIRKEIPTREWYDKTEMIPNVLYAMVIDFVENEKCFENIEYNSDPTHKRFARKLKSAYNWAKTGRKKMQADIDQLLSEASDKRGNLTYEERYGAMNKLETKFRRADTTHLKFIVESRNMFWT